MRFILFRYKHFWSRFFVIINLIFLSGCLRAVKVNAPVTGLVSSTVYENDATAVAAVTSIYDRMSNAGLSDGINSISLMVGLLADELNNYDVNDVVLSQFYTNSLTSNPNKYFWTELFQQIYVSNSVIKGLSESKGLTEKVKSRLMGEAKFIRAFLNFYGVNLYGDFPLVLTTDYRKNNVIKRSSQSEVYRQIIADLKDAKGLLSDDYLSPSGATSQERVRPNKGAAVALLARVYLYMGEWKSAEEEASIVLNNSAMYALMTDVNQAFIISNTEAIWQLQSIIPGENTEMGRIMVLTSAPGSSGFSVALSDNLLNAFESGDVRKINWVGEFADASSGEEFYYCNKYKANIIDVDQPVTEYLMVLRLAEQYLIRAEARANLGDVTGAQADLNVIRTRAGLKNTAASTTSALLAAIYHERQVELFGEWGHRWFDLKRTGKLNSIMSEVTPEKGGAWNNNWALLPIPRSEILLNPNLDQNPGYN